MGERLRVVVGGVAEGLGVPSVVNSPTFVLMNEHVGRLRLFHIDAYRLGGGDEELQLLGWDRLATGDAIVLIEWADRIAHLIDRPAIAITLEHAGESARRITVARPDRPGERIGEADGRRSS